MSKRKSKYYDARYDAFCAVCDSTYDGTNPADVKVHEHPEPQSGEYRDAWLESRLPYEEWIKQTPLGREWHQQAHLK